jgi:hypothetical protein
MRRLAGRFLFAYTLIQVFQQFRVLGGKDQAINPVIEEDIYDTLASKTAITRRHSLGGVYTKA